MGNFRLPPHFSDHVNRVSKGLSDYYAARAEDDRNKALASVFCGGCILLNSINYDDLESELEELRQKAESVGEKNLERKFFKEFDEFLIAESEAFLQIGMDDRARRYMVECISDVRGISKIEPQVAITKLTRLRDELCHYCREYSKAARGGNIEKAHREGSTFKYVWGLTRKIFSGVVVVADLGLAANGIIDVATAALSVQAAQAGMELLPD
jgi:hypothetical protein